MKIERLDVVPYALRFRAPYVTARGKLERRELALVRLTANGLEGLGEAAPLALRGGDSLEEVVRDLERCRALLEGRPVGAGPSADLEPCAAAGASQHALRAIELALLDLHAKDAGIPVWKLLDESVRSATPVRCNATLSAGPPSHVAEEALRWAERGFDTFKLKVGMERDVEQVRAAREALGERAKIRIDANASWERRQAVEKLRQLEPVGIELVEQPVGTIEEMAAVRSAVAVPVAADESVNTADDARRAAAAKACDAATVKLAKVGLVHAAFDIARHLPVYLSSALDGPVGIAAAVHVAQGLPRQGFAAQLAHGLATGELFAETIAATECRLLAAALTPSDAPGWGVEIDERALDRCRLA